MKNKMKNYLFLKTGEKHFPNNEGIFDKNIYNFLNYLKDLFLSSNISHHVSSLIDIYVCIQMPKKNTQEWQKSNNYD